MNFQHKPCLLPSKGLRRNVITLVCLGLMPLLTAHHAYGISYGTSVCAKELEAFEYFLRTERPEQPEIFIQGLIYQEKRFYSELVHEQLDTKDFGSIQLFQYKAMMDKMGKKISRWASEINQKTKASDPKIKEWAKALQEEVLNPALDEMRHLSQMNEISTSELFYIAQKWVLIMELHERGPWSPVFKDFPGGHPVTPERLKDFYVSLLDRANLITPLEDFYNSLLPKEGHRLIEGLHFSNIPFIAFFLEDDPLMNKAIVGSNERSFAFVLPLSTRQENGVTRGPWERFLKEKERFKKAYHEFERTCEQLENIPEDELPLIEGKKINYEDLFFEGPDLERLSPIDQSRISFVDFLKFMREEKVANDDERAFIEKQIEAITYFLFSDQKLPFHHEFLEGYIKFQLELIERGSDVDEVMTETIKLKSKVDSPFISFYLRMPTIFDLQDSILNHKYPELDNSSALRQIPLKDWRSALMIIGEALEASRP